jgi:hypothetical protein
MSVVRSQIFSKKIDGREKRRGFLRKPDFRWLIWAAKTIK